MSRILVFKNEVRKCSASTTSRKVGEGVPYENVLKDVTVKEQQLPQSADVVIIGILLNRFN